MPAHGTHAERDTAQLIFERIAARLRPGDEGDYTDAVPGLQASPCAERFAAAVLRLTLATNWPRFAWCLVPICRPLRLVDGVLARFAGQRVTVLAGHGANRRPSKPEPRIRPGMTHSEAVLAVCRVLAFHAAAVQIFALRYHRQMSQLPIATARDTRNDSAIRHYFRPN